jgi:DNA-3-methyladenine glycosylase II
VITPRLARPSHRSAAVELATRDQVLGSLIEAAGPPTFRRPSETAFAALSRSILYQQLAGPAAAAIHGRLVAAMGDADDPAALLALSDEALRGVGLSRNKTLSLRDLATKVLDGTVDLDRRHLGRASDAQIVGHLSMVRGIGEWTAQMFLMFQLCRLDVWPTGDLGVRRGYGLAWRIPPPTARELEPLGDAFRPYRSVAAWSCWRACELYAGAADSALTR